jgi:hypothetical protein
MNKLIDRTYINKNIKWYQVDSNFNVDHVSDYAEISASIDHWKNILVEQANVGPGSTVALNIGHRDLRWISLMFAIWELGASYVLQNPSFSLFHAPFTATVVDSQEKADEEQPHTGCVIQLDVWHHYVAKHNTMDHMPHGFSDRLAMILAVTASADLVPKSVEYSHAFSRELSDRCVGIHKFNPNDRMLHLHGSHHGGGLNNMLLPSLNVCEHHYGAILNFDKLAQIADFVEHERINKMSMPNSITTERFIQNAKKFTKAVDILSLQGNQLNWLDLMREKNINSVTSLFGCMEMSSPVFINTIAKDSPDTHNCMDFGFPIDDFYQVKLVNGNKLQVSNKYQGTVIFPDEFELTDTGYEFRHRNSYLRINDVILSVTDLDNIVKQTTDPSLVYLLADPTMNRVYLLIDKTVEQPDDIVNMINAELSKLSPLVQINYVDQMNLSDFRACDMTLNEFHVRNHFRIKFKLR